jgi:hypothetical protein
VLLAPFAQRPNRKVRMLRLQFAKASRNHQAANPAGLRTTNFRQLPLSPN